MVNRRPVPYDNNNRRRHIYIVVLVISGIVLGILLNMLFKHTSFRSSRKKAPPKKRPPTSKFCPLCHGGLQPGQNIKSVVYPGSGETHDKITEIYGCPYCYPANDKNIRICPVCKKPVPADGFVIARMFDKSPRVHVHVLGCTRCYRRH